MKIWTSDHVFDHPWETVVHAAFRKYPNPMNRAVTAIDVVSQDVEKGVIKSERLLQSQFSIPSWATKLTGFSGVQYSHEYTEIDPSKRLMTLATRNLNGISFLRVDERLTYVPDPADSQKTILKQEASVSINLPAFTDYCERAFLSVYQTNALKGRTGVEWVIESLKREYNEISSKVSSEVHDLSDKVMSHFSSHPH
jgi:hypothetical protein